MGTASLTCEITATLIDLLKSLYLVYFFNGFSKLFSHL